MTKNELQSAQASAQTKQDELKSVQERQLLQLADEVKTQRKRRHLSLEALAESSGVSRSMISKIERCEAVPSATVLSRLAEALGVRFSQLMAPEVEQEIVFIPAQVQPVLRDEASGFHRRVISPVLPGRGIDWVINSLPLGGVTGQFVPHRRGVEEYIYVLHGQLKAVIGTRTIVMNEGDSLYFQADAPHEFTNIGGEICKYFLVIDSSKLR